MENRDHVKRRLERSRVGTSPTEKLNSELVLCHDEGLRLDCLNPFRAVRRDQCPSGRTPNTAKILTDSWRRIPACKGFLRPSLIARSHFFDRKNQADRSWASTVPRLKSSAKPNCGLVGQVRFKGRERRLELPFNRKAPS
jgi:hypothetical protein